MLEKLPLTSPEEAAFSQALDEYFLSGLLLSFNTV